MPRLVIKPIPDRDEYVGWSTVVDSPLTGGTREQMLEWVAGASGMNRGVEGAAELMDRVDEVGTSIKQDPDSTFQWRFGEWTDDSFIYEQIGTIARQRLYPMFRLLVTDRERDALDLLDPLEDEPDYPGELSARLQAVKDRLDSEARAKTAATERRVAKSRRSMHVEYSRRLKARRRRWRTNGQR